MPVLFAQAAEAGASTGGNAASAIGWTIAVIAIVGFVIAILINVRRGKAEVGSELTLAPNRKPYLSDEELEGKKLDRTLGAGLVMLAMISLALPLYWLYEPARQEGAVKKFEEESIGYGEIIYTTKAKCVDCHGPQGVGGSKSTPILNESGEFVRTVTWQAPALNTVLYRYSKEEVKFILNYGRGNSPMPAWGAPGGGPLTDQQLDNVIAYLQSIQLPAEEAKAALTKEIEKVCKPDADEKCTVVDPSSPNGEIKYPTLGAALFNLGLYDGFAGGAYSCGRCHTKGWSYGAAEVAGGGALGPNLTGGSELRQFELPQSQVDFVSKGSELGKRYGRNGNGSGQMPGFGLNPNAEEKGAVMQTNQVMLTQEQVAAVVEYERSL